MQQTQRDTETMALLDAALALKLGYLTARHWLLTGRLDGWRTERGRWVVTRESVQRAQNAT